MAMINRSSNLNKLSSQELEQILRIKQRQERQERFIRLTGQGRSSQTALLETDDVLPALQQPEQHPAASNAGLLQTPRYHPRDNQAHNTTPPSRLKQLREGLLLTIEIGLVVGLVAILFAAYQNLQNLNQEMASTHTAMVDELAVGQTEMSLQDERILQAQAMPITLLPGGHTSPSAPGGAMPEIPAHLQNWVQPPPVVPVETPDDVPHATRIVIPKINVDAPIVPGVTWEDLKKGVGHLPGSAQPGQRGNMYLAAHNDIFGEIFRYLDKLDVGDEFQVYAGETSYTYVVREKRIIEPHQVEVMLPTTEPVATLQTCYPYLIDTHRLVVVADLLR